MADERKVVVVGDGIHSAAAMAALLAGGLAGHQAIILQGDPYRDVERMLDTIDVLNLFARDDRPRDRMGFRHPHPPERAQIVHINTPKPISKRKARRLRGKDTQNG